MSRYNLFKKELKDLCANVGIQGMKNVSRSDKDPIQRIAWFMIIMVSFLLSGIVIKNSVKEWQSNPVLITIETTDYPIEKIPFPAVTICPEKNEPSCFEIIAKMFDYVEFPIFMEKNSSNERLAAREKLKMFDSFLAKITDKMKSQPMRIIPPGKLFETYSEIDLAERELIDLLVLQVKNNVSESFVLGLLDTLMKEMGNFPGPFNMTHGKNIFRHFLTPKLREILRFNGFETSLRNFEVLPYFNDKTARSVVINAINFLDKINAAFIKVVSGELFEERPDLYLGRLISMFPNWIYPADLGLVKMPNNETDPLSWALYKVLIQKLLVIQHMRGSLSCLSRLGESLLPHHYDILLEVIKHSQLGQTTLAGKNSKSFEEKFVRKSFNLRNLSIAEPKYLEDDPKFFEFCAFGSSLWLSNVSGHSDRCGFFDTTITGKGLCKTFNGFPMAQVYKSSPTVDAWSNIFQTKQDSHLQNPTGFGPSHGLTVVVNLFRTMSMEGTSKNSILSIASAEEWVNVFANHYLIQPGYAYTFKVLANQLITTKRFEELRLEDRNCLLPHENKNLKFMRNFTKGGCLYECAIKQIIERNNCTPWNLPKNKNSDPPFCEEKFVATAAGSVTSTEIVYSGFSANSCECPSNCAETIFTVFDTKEQLDNPGLNCNEAQVFDRRRGVFPYMVLCNLCRKILKFYRIWFNYKFMVMNATNPEDFPHFCNDFLMNNVGIIKVEMATPSLTQSVRDKRFNFEAQISDLGGTLGLFVGMSLMTAIEIVFWIIQLLYKLTLKPGPSRE